MMHRFHTAGRAAHRSIASGLSALGAAALLGVSRPAAAQVAEAPAAATEEAELPHPFFTHMGLLRRRPHARGAARVPAHRLRLAAAARDPGGSQQPPGFVWSRTEGYTAFTHFHTPRGYLSSPLP
jgi:hypothetical protein